MNYTNYLKQISLIVLFFSFGNFIFAFPNFEFSESNYESGEVDVTFSASQGVRVSLYSNENYIDAIDVFSEPVVIELDSEIKDEFIPVNSNVVFRNVHPTNVFSINISGVMFKRLNPGTSSSQQYFDSVSNFDYRNEETGALKQIIIEDSVVEKTFVNVYQNYLENGENVFRFQVTSLDNSFETYSEEFNVDYNKFPNNILVDSFDNITNEKRVTISGSVSDSQYPLYYVLNLDGDLANLGALKEVTLDANRFNFTITNLAEGLNSVRIISTDLVNKNIFTGQVFSSVLVDKEKPVIDISKIYFKSNTDGKKKAFLDGENIDTNSNSIVLNISADGIELNYTFNNKTETSEIIGGNIELELNLKDGKNSLDLKVVDAAGNLAHKAHQINYDNEKPGIVEDSLKPDAVFEEKNVHFFLQNVEGKTNKPNVNMVIFTISEDTTNEDGDKVTCNSYENVFFRNLNNAEDDGNSEPIPNIPDGQLSLLSLISQKNELKSDSDGNFETLISLQEKNLEFSDLNSTKVSSVKTKNTICMVLVDKFGNEKIEDFSVTFDAGNTLWDDVEITVTPSTVYEAELLQLEEGQRTGSGNVEVGIIAQFQYLGSSQVKDITSVRVIKDTKAYPDTKYVNVESSRVNYAYEKDSNLLTVFVPVSVKKIDTQEERDERDWFDEIEIGFGLSIVYGLEEIDVPIDTVNPVYFQTKVVVENTQDWLSVEKIEKAQAFLNKTIKVTEQFTEGMKWASLGGVVYCTYAKFQNAWDRASIEVSDSDDKEAEYNKADRELYMACDRIAGLPAPYKCDGAQDQFMSKDEYSHGVSYTQGDKVVGKFEPNVGGDCNTDTVTGGKWVSGSGKKYSDESSSGFSHTVEAELDFDKQCLPYDKETDSVNFGAFKGQVCYSAGAPNFDDTKCNFFGADTVEEGDGEWSQESGVSGKSSSVSILSSIRCGAIVDTYSHSKNLLKIQQGIYDCLEQAKIGTVKGSYCQRLFGQAVCDVATNVILPELQQSYNSQSGAEGSGERKPTFDFFGQMNKNKEKFESRYDGSILSQSGLSSDSIINKACLGAITGDWSALTENILSSIEANEVEPTFGPPFPESRLQGYDPVTGQLSIRYLFTYGALSGGQAITSKIELICDKGYDNSEFCPDEGVIVSSEVNAGSFKSKTLIVRDGGSKQESQIITEAPARVWYNKLRITHSYDMKGTKQTKVQEFPIAHKAETLFAQCSFSAGLLGAGAGFKCDSIFGDSSESNLFTIDTSKSRIVPRSSESSITPKPFYSGESVSGKIKFTSPDLNLYTDDAAIVYYGVCNEGKDNEYYLHAEKTKKNEIGFIRIENDKLGKGFVVNQLFEELPLVGDSSGLVATHTGEGAYFVKITSTDKDKVVTFTPTSIVIDGVDETSEPKEVHGSDEDKYIVFKANMTNKLQISYGGELSNIDFKVELIPQNGSYIGGLESRSGKQISFKSASVSPGSCNVNLKMIEYSNVDLISSVETFKNYNPNAGTDEEGNIISNVPVNTREEKISFTLSKESNVANKYYFDITSLDNNDNYPVDLDSSSLDLKLEFIFGGNYRSDKMSGEFRLSVDRLDFGDKGLISVDSKKFENFINNDELGLIFDILEDNNLVSTTGSGWDYFFGSSQTPKLTLDYDIFDNGVSKNKGSISFYLRKNN